MKDGAAASSPSARRISRMATLRTPSLTWVFAHPARSSSSLKTTCPRSSTSRRRSVKPSRPHSARPGCRSKNQLPRESGRPGSNRRRPAWEAFLALAGQGFFDGGSRNGITQYAGDAARFRPHLFAPLDRLPVRRGDQMTSLRGEVAVVSGASSGVGKATVQALVGEGVRVTSGARGGDGLRSVRVDAGAGVETG